jgi:hypothetical protein
VKRSFNDLTRERKCFNDLLREVISFNDRFHQGADVCERLWLSLSQRDDQDGCCESWAWEQRVMFDTTAQLYSTYQQQDSVPTAIHIVAQLVGLYNILFSKISLLCSAN